MRHPNSGTRCEGINYPNLLQIDLFGVLYDVLLLCPARQTLIESRNISTARYGGQETHGGDAPDISRPVPTCLALQGFLTIFWKSSESEEGDLFARRHE
jgi:hypothetical protein